MRESATHIRTNLSEVSIEPAPSFIPPRSFPGVIPVGLSAPPTLGRHSFTTPSQLLGEYTIPQALKMVSPHRGVSDRHVPHRRVRRSHLNHVRIPCRDSFGTTTPLLLVDYQHISPQVNSARRLRSATSVYAKETEVTRCDPKCLVLGHRWQLIPAWIVPSPP